MNISIYIYGNGKECKKTLARLADFREQITVKGIVVSNKNNELNSNSSIDIYELNEIDDYDFILISVYKWKEIYAILQENDIPNEKIVLSAELYNTNVDIEDIFLKKDRRNIVEPSYYLDEENYGNEYMKETILHYPPRHITIAVTSVCKNKCLFCAYHGEGFKENSRVYNLPFVLDLKRFKEMVDMAYNGNVPHIHICGTGEPFANPQIIKMIDYVIYRYGSTSIQTEFWPDLFAKNNYLDEICKREKNIDYITTDLFSADFHVHDNIKRGTKLSEIITALKYISENSNICIRINIILTRKNYKDLYRIIDLLDSNNIKNYEVDVINLYTYEGDIFTSKCNQYHSEDEHITTELTKLKSYALQQGVKCCIPEPIDKSSEQCDHFWTKFQTWPVIGCDKDKYAENMVPMACAAVVNGELNSLGYLCDYKNIMEAWNNERIVSIRRNLLKGIYPSPECRNCHLCKSEE